METGTNPNSKTSELSKSMNLSQNKSDVTLLTDDKMTRYRTRLRIMALSFLSVGLGMLLYSCLYLLASIDPNFESGVYASPILTVNYLLWTVGSIFVLVIGGLALSLQRDVTSRKRAVLVNGAGKF